MKRQKKVDLLTVEVAERMKLAWETRRQLQQEILEKKLAEYVLKPRKARACIQRYPEAMQPMIQDFIRKAQEQKSHYTI